jgi:hypothetical protein
MPSVLAGMIRQEECPDCPGILLHPLLVQHSSGDLGSENCDQQEKTLENNSTESNTLNPLSDSLGKTPISITLLAL